MSDETTVVDESAGSEPQDLMTVLADVGAGEFSKAGFDRVAAAAYSQESAVGELRDLLGDWSRVESAVSAKGKSSVLQGFCALVAGDAEAGEKVLSEQKSDPWGAYHLARSLLWRGLADDALQVATAVAKKSSDFLPMKHLLVEIHHKRRDLDAAQAVLKEVEAADGESAACELSRGLCFELAGDYPEAIEAYRSAVAKDDDCSEAYFRLGYLLDIHGSDADEANDEAVLAYECCVKSAPIHLNAVVNLGLLYEDRERYHDAIKCYETALRYYPNHSRAKLYLADAQASTTMFYDREQEKKADRQSQVLKIPVTDFELSVRSRNCLQKMNIRTLGDLIMKSEQELLAYKNFGETSLEEIKNMLQQKGLHLGQGLEDGGSEPQHGRNPLEATADPDVLDKPIEDLELSVRSRRCMERLGVRSVRDLINKTEVDLMSAKNFGMTSLNEIKLKLGELGLSLRS